MLSRTMFALRRLSCLIVLPAALALASCGGSFEGDTVTGPSVLSDESASSGTASGVKASKTSKVLICHKGADKWVPPSTVAGHLGHGDSLDSCSAPPACPCFSAPDIQAVGSQCGSPPSATCGTGDTHYLFMGCSPGGDVPPGVLGVYITQTGDGATCQRDDLSGSFGQTGLTAAEYQACVDAIDNSGFCS